MLRLFSGQPRKILCDFGMPIGSCVSRSGALRHTNMKSGICTSFDQHYYRTRRRRFTRDGLALANRYEKSLLTNR